MSSQRANPLSLTSQKIILSVKKNIKSRAIVFKTIYLAFCFALTSCGGGNGSPASVSGSDKEAPTMQIAASVIDKTADSAAQVHISVTTAQDNIDVTAFCLTTNSTRPSSKDTCFGDAREWTVSIGPAWHAWARDAAGNVSAGVTDGPCSSEAKAAAAASSLPTVCIMTDAGEIVLELESNKAPISANNYMNYVFDGFYADTIFHRIKSDFVVQGGGFAVVNGSRTQKTTADGLRAAITLEKTTDTGLSNLTGTVAMARTTDPNSATSQFFINVVDNKSLDATATADGYAVFGRVIYGMDTTVQTLRNVSVVDNGSGEVSSPTQNIFTRWAYLMK
jgi:cyclophilin family peptidyl-prolyl cis-trans isomerase